MFKKTYSFDDVLLVPQKSDIRSRSEIDIGSDVGVDRPDVPICSAPIGKLAEQLI